MVAHQPKEATTMSTTTLLIHVQDAYKAARRRDDEWVEVLMSAHDAALHAGRDDVAEALEGIDPEGSPAAAAADLFRIEEALATEPEATR